MSIIHVSGAPGSGKTTLGNQLRENKKIVVMDLDDLFSEFAKSDTKFDPKKYQKYIYAFIDRQKSL